MDFELSKLFESKGLPFSFKLIAEVLSRFLKRLVVSQHSQILLLYWGIVYANERRPFRPPSDFRINAEAP